LVSLGWAEILKFDLLADGLRVDPAARDAWIEAYDGPLTLAEYATTSGITVVLPGGLYVNAPIAPITAAATLRWDGSGFSLRTAAEDVPVDVVPVPAFHRDTQVDRLNGTEQPHTNYGVTHTDRCRVSPIAGCAWKCRFCDLPYEFSYRKRHVDNLLKVVETAQDDLLAPARHVLISGGTPRRGRLGSSDEDWIDSVYESLATRSPLPVDVMMPPRRDMTYPSWLKSIDINMVSINMEVSDAERARALAPAKFRLGRRHYLDYIERAVETFGVGRVQSLIVFGASIEPLESTLQGVKDLVSRGCIPVLSPFRPAAVTPLGKFPGATAQEMATAFLSTVDLCEKADNGVRPGPRCIPCHHNTVTLPDESDFYLGLDADITDQCLAC
jgi:hypothetical protein